MGGVASAQYKLGEMYENGWGVPQDLRAAKDWYGEACDWGDDEGCEKYRELDDAGY